jgi:uncharacterized protein (TIGR03435 family)
MFRSALIFAFGFGVAVLSAQAPDAAPAFEVASIKPAPNEPPLPVGLPSPDRFYRPTVTLRSLINYAYGVQDFRIVGGPEWAASERWQVSAKAATAVPPLEMARLVQRLLADRFAIKAHMETRELQIYYLVPARNDGRLGPQMNAAEFDCEPFLTGERRAMDAPIDPETGITRCATRVRMGGGVRTVRYRGVASSRLARFLSTAVNRVILDNTGLRGSHDVELTFQDDTAFIGSGSRRQREAPSLFTALQEQLGLKLEPARGPVEVLVIDSVERPTPD